MKCRHCHSELYLSFIDLGSAPPSNAYLTIDTLHTPEKWYPLRVLVCTKCWLVQTDDFAQAEELFSSDYAYFSSFSSTWLAHAEQYVEGMVKRFELSATSHVIEVAANDGYLLQYVKRQGIPCLGIEPTASTATMARAKGIPIVEDFFGDRLAQHLTESGKQADLIIANNVLAHVPNINDFVSGFVRLLKPTGVATFEFPHLLRLVENTQFDTIYHEHFSYLSFTAVNRIFSNAGLVIFDVEDLQTHGGSLRVFAQLQKNGNRSISSRVHELLSKEDSVGVTSPEYYRGFHNKVIRLKNDLLSFLIEAKRAGKNVAAYGAAAKGNTLLNYSGIRPDLIPWVVDRNPVKQGLFMPGNRIPIVTEEHIKSKKPDYILILPWNIQVEVKSQLSYVHEWGAKFITAIPNLEISK